jgi:LysM repeat protein
MSRGRHARPGHAQIALKAGTTAATGTFAAGAVAAVAVSGHAPPVHNSYHVNVVKVTETAYVTTAAKERPASPASYDVQQGDTLWGISAAHCGTGNKYQSLANANSIQDANLIYVGQHIVLDCDSGAVAKVDQDGTPGQSYTPPVQSSSSSTSSQSPPPAVAADTTPSGGALSCSGLESLWEQAGGSSGEAQMAASIAMAESGGLEDATDYDSDGSVDRGLWQINSTNGSLSTYSPIGNAEAAVSLSSDGANWSPWVTFTTGAYQGKC